MTDTRAELAETYLEKAYRILEKSGAYVPEALINSYKRDLYGFYDISITSLGGNNQFYFKVDAVWITLTSQNSAKPILNDLLLKIDIFRKAGITDISIADKKGSDLKTFKYDPIKDSYSAEYAFCGRKDKEYWIINKEGVLQLAGEETFINHTE